MPEGRGKECATPQSVWGSKQCQCKSCLAQTAPQAGDRQAPGGDAGELTPRVSSGDITPEAVLSPDGIRDGSGDPAAAPNDGNATGGKSRATDGRKSLVAEPTMDRVSSGKEAPPHNGDTFARWMGRAPDPSPKDVEAFRSWGTPETIPVCVSAREREATRLHDKHPACFRCGLGLDGCECERARVRVSVS